MPSDPAPSSPPPSPATNARAALIPTWRSRTAWVWLLAATLFALGADLGSKHLAFKHIADEPVIITREQVLEVPDPRDITPALLPRDVEPVVVVPHVLEFTLVLNPGAVFGTGPGKRAFFMGFTIVVLLFGLFMFAKWTRPRDHWVHAALGMVFGGGLGNLYDRAMFACVRDFIHPLPGVNWPFGMTVRGSREMWPYVSNVADLLLLIGIGMLLVYLWRYDTAMHQDKKQTASTPATQA